MTEKELEERLDKIQEAAENNERRKSLECSAISRDLRW